MAQKVTETVTPNPISPEQSGYNQQAIDANAAWLANVAQIAPSVIAGIQNGASGADLANMIYQSVGAYSDQALASVAAPTTQSAPQMPGVQPTYAPQPAYSPQPAYAPQPAYSPPATAMPGGPLGGSQGGLSAGDIADNARNAAAAASNAALETARIDTLRTSLARGDTIEVSDDDKRTLGIYVPPPPPPGVGLAPPQVSATPPATFQSAPYNPTEDYGLIANAADTAITAGQKDIDRFFGDAMKVLHEQATARGMRFGDSPMLDRGGQIATDVLRQKEDLAQGIRAQQASMNLTYPLEKYTTLSNVGVNEGRLGLDAWTGAQQVDQFGRSLAQNESQFGRRLGLDTWLGQQQVDQFGRSLGQQESQFGRTLGQNESQFGRSLALDAWTGQQQADQFGRSLAQNQSQFDSSLGFDRMSLAQAAEQFNSTMGLNNRTLSADVAQRGIENRLAGANALMDRYNFGVNSGLNLINVTRPNPPQFPDAGSTGVSRTSGSSTAQLLGGAGGLLEGIGAIAGGGVGGLISKGIGKVAGKIFSSRGLKDVHEDVLPEKALDGVVNTPVSKWSYKGESTRHIGPMAEDFQKAFGVGDGKTISIIDAIGVLFAAIQGLDQKIGEMNHAN